jgi:hypothetical protein
LHSGAHFPEGVPKFRKAKIIVIAKKLMLFCCPIQPKNVFLAFQQLSMSAKNQQTALQTTLLLIG